MITLYGPNGQPLKVSSRNELVTSDAFSEAVSRGRVFSVANQVGVASQAGLSVTTPVLSLVNFPKSGVKGKLWYAGCTFEVVFAAVAAIWLAAGGGVLSTIAGTRTVAERNLKSIGSIAGNVIKPYLAATLPVVPVGIALLGHGLTGAVTTVPGQLPYGRWFNGAVRIEEATNLSIQTSTASGATGMWCEYIWEEEDS